MKFVLALTLTLLASGDSFGFFQPDAYRGGAGDKGTEEDPTISFIPIISLVDSNDFPCTALGTFEDPTDCLFYYQCFGMDNGDYNSSRIKCPENKHYNKEDSVCEYGPCPVITTTTTPGPFVCSSLGTYPDPRDCHCYMDCYGLPDGGMNYTKICCTTDYHYDSASSQCEYGDC
ncbi:uncharacterized protein [Hetaerina americana]|uniref:uncharacterized protein n=1 Tax=Hetaerina americana TaxID=62018 RepID=UPI003A7F27F3